MHRALPSSRWIRGIRRPTSRIVLPTVLTLAAGLGLTACSSSADSEAKASAPVQGGTLRFAVHTQPTNLDPHSSPSDVTALLTRHVVDSLVAIDAEGKIKPWLATSWTVSPDQRSYTFTLRDGVRFSDGTSFDAAAVKANLDHVVDPKTKSALAAGLIPAYERTEVLDPLTAKVTFSRPHAPFLASLSTPYLGIQSPAALARGQEALARNVVGSGPFVMESFEPGKLVTYRRNPDYAWPPQDAELKGPAYLDRLEISIIPEDSIRVGALSSGQVDAIGGVPSVSVKQLEANPNITVQRQQASGGNYNYYPNTSAGPFADVRVRQAFRVGIDFATIVKSLYFGVYEPATSPIAAVTVGYDPGTRDLQRHDPQAAAALLDQAGWTGRDDEGYRTRDGQRLVVRWMFVRAIAREQRPVLAEQVQAAARKIGIDVQFLDVTLSTYPGIAARGDYDLADFSWQRIDADALRDLFHSTNVPTETGSGANAARYQDKQVDAWLDRTLETGDPAERAELYASIQRKVLEDAAVFPVYSPSYVFATSKRANGISWEQPAYPAFYGAWTTGE
ncbi:ABC transporter substrate-binding protein [Micromonospora endophytica]|uniref:Peptide ABC transporter substrate-binding protein n=1 Tax=Micromonospora endophytica TaxID=515350 RepID=A0A2W2CRI5_9ACTN|nr:ABC transporter substrate-binding protein [Micromonospora endophytica]PZG01203.1 peptide ABC transporter substrate-binding protein [Micromonospora endophytica]RIW45856.1 ABC transporter substrate-binding protein [Micromonospora endophytica]BCJ61873.1 peptide ABC transporter [Micromonospora endophytica]